MTDEGKGEGIRIHYAKPDESLSGLIDWWKCKKDSDCGEGYYCNTETGVCKPDIYH